MNIAQLKNVLTVVMASEEDCYGSSSGDRDTAINDLLEEAYTIGYQDSEEGRSRQVKGY